MKKVIITVVIAILVLIVLAWVGQLSQNKLDQLKQERSTSGQTR